MKSRGSRSRIERSSTCPLSLQGWSSRSSAALHSIPEDMYEAADLDGAGIWSKVWMISLPFLKPLLIINFVGAFIGTFQTMQNVFVMTGGGPGDSTYLVGLYIFFNSFVWLQF